MLVVRLVYVFSLLIALTFADDFTYPPKFGAIGEYVSNLNFTVGQTITLEWDSSATSELSFWLVQDDSGSQCTFQSNAQCARIASKSFCITLLRNSPLTVWQCRFSERWQHVLDRQSHVHRQRRYLLYHRVRYTEPHEWRDTASFQYALF